MSRFMTRGLASLFLAILVLGARAYPLANADSCILPVITQNPQNAPNITPGALVTFTLAASGPASIIYQWYISSDAGHTWSPDTTAVGRNSSYSYAVKQGDDGKQFRCSAKNATCGDTVLSAPAILNICAPPSFSLQPQNTAVVDGQTALFTVNATATGAGLTYRWQRKDNGSATWTDIINETGNTFSIATLFGSDSNASFRCIATSHCDTTAVPDTSKAAVLTVFRKVQARFWASNYIGFVPDTVQFIDSSKGNDSLFTWNFGDGRPSITSRVPQNIQYVTFTSPGAYVVTLIVSGISGTDTVRKTINVYPRGDNPLTLFGSYRRNDSVSLTFKNYAGLKGPGSTEPRYVTAMKLWNKSGAIPSEADTLSGSAVLLKTYQWADIAAWQAQGSTSTDSTVPRAQHLPSDSVSGFITQIVWNDTSYHPPFTAANGCLVTMRPPNSLVLKANYSPWDTVTFAIDSTHTIDTTVSDTVGIWFGIGADSIPSFSTSTNVIWLSAKQVLAGSVNHRYTFVDTSSKFNSDLKTLHAAVIIKGKNKVFSNPAFATTTIGRKRPDNPLRLYAHAAGAGSVVVKWSGLNPPYDSISRVRIFYQQNQPVPPGYQHPDLDSALIDSAHIAWKDTTDTITYRIRPQTRYYFAAQVFRKRLWSYLDSAHVTDSTPQCTGSECDTIRNTATIDTGTTMYFDTTTNLLHIHWSVDTSATGTGNLQIALSFNHYKVGGGDAPQDQSDSILTPPIPVSSGKPSPTLPIYSGDTAVSLGSQIMYDTTMYAYVWLKPANRLKWSRPVKRYTLPNCPFGWQAISYKFKAGGDTASLVSDRIRIVTPAVTEADPDPYTGIIHSRNLAGTDSGFVKAGQPFYFKAVPQQSRPFSIWMKCNLPAGRSLQDAQIYRYDTVHLRWVAQKTSYDPTSTYAIISTNALSAPFALLVDTLPPIITLHNHLDTLAGAPIQDTVDISDNAGGFWWKFSYRDGGDDTSLAVCTGPDTVSAGPAKAIVSIREHYLLRPRRGLQALISVGDGRNTVVANVSPAIRFADSSGSVNTTALKWSPIFVNGIADSFPVKQLISAASSGGYDAKKILLFRYDSAWVEYAPTGDTTAFNIKAGRLFWAKTRSDVSFPLGQAVSIPLSDTFSITLPPKRWTDFALPFSFDMRVGDVINATLLGQSADQQTAIQSLQLYRWVSNAGIYSCEALYGLPPAMDKTAIMNYQAMGVGGANGFTVYNPGLQPVVLKFPPTCSKISTVTSSALAKTAVAGWTVKVLAKSSSGTPLSPIFCGYSPSDAAAPTFYMMPPSLQTAVAGVCDENSGFMRGHQFSHRMDQGGCSYLLAFKNESKERENIRFQLQSLSDLPSGVETAIINPITGEPVSHDANGYSAPVSGQSTVYCQLLVGSANFIASAATRIPRLALMKVYPNPLRGTVHLRYSLPIGQMGKVEFQVIDLRGRMVWNKTLHENAVGGGVREYLWDRSSNGGSRLSSGVYFLRMSAFDAQGKSLGSFERKLTCLE